MLQVVQSEIRTGGSWVEGLPANLDYAQGLAFRAEDRRRHEFLNGTLLRQVAFLPAGQFDGLEDPCVFDSGKELKSSVFLVDAVCAATDAELETGIDPAVLSCSGNRNFSRPFSKRNKATSLGRTPKSLDKAAQNLSGSGAWPRTNCTELSEASAGAAATAPSELDFSAIKPYASAEQESEITNNSNHGDGLWGARQVTEVICPTP